MASSVFYRFNSRKDESRVAFDGTGISVFDLKRDIILAHNLAKANDFDLKVIDGDSKEELLDDGAIIPRSSFVIIKRVPAARPGKGKASMYVAGTASLIPTSESVQRGSGFVHKGAMSKRFDGRDDSQTKFGMPSNLATPVKTNVANDDETAAMAAMFQAQSANWEEAQEKMSQSVDCSFIVCPTSSATRIYNNQRGPPRPGKPGPPTYQPPDRPLPASYVCYRCGQKGHWIKDCPTNSDREFDHKPRIKRTTGIPRSMLKAVENINNGELGQGVMVTPEGGYVVAQPDLASWQKQVSRTNKVLTAAEVRDRNTPSDLTLVCPIDNKLFRDAVETPCCGTSYCEDCIQTHLLERDFICPNPNCGKKIASLDKLSPNHEQRRRVSEYIQKAIEDSRREAADSDEMEDGTKVGHISLIPKVVGRDFSSFTQETINLEQDFYSDQQPGMDVQQLIPMLQAQISQISVALQNPSLPPRVRQQTEVQQEQLKIQLQQAQTISVALAAATEFQQQQQQAQQMQMQNIQQQQGSMGGSMGYNNNMYPSQGGPSQVIQDSAYQRLPVNNRRRNLKRDRPSDFLEIGNGANENDAKVARYWE
ncbi:DWNN domain-containing protein [Lentinula lateritia]|uniref:DWNN domain-containing protein n=1 Tax=Lentinula aff. lateritia TaxID=2804960 RepID=A0ACC1UEV7_9AGAR|nr:DWNN domain-containing protein [Lentinula aff. lateritia]KAJ3857554.1 DWNN domain-containing protein [Lentinula lateritia]